MSYLTIATQIIKFLVALFADSIVSKWVAYFLIAWQNQANAEAQRAFAEAVNEVKKNMPEKAKSWDDWRRKSL